MQLDIERLHETQHTQTNAASSDNTNIHTLNVVRLGDAVGNVPAALLAGPLVGGDVVAHETENHHNGVLGNTVGVGVSDLSNSDTGLVGSIEIDVVRTNTSSQSQLEVLGPRDAISVKVGGPEGLRDNNISSGQLALENRVRAVLVRSDNKLVAVLLEELAQSELTAHATEQMARGKVNCLGSRSSLSIRILGDVREVVTEVGRRVAINRIRIQDAEDLHAFAASAAKLASSGSGRCFHSLGEHWE